MTGFASSSSQTPSREDAVKLILQAFEVARQSGREDWAAMTVAVLKNRLLTLTGRTFDETAWGATSMREFVATFPELLSLDLDTHPPTARLSGATAQQEFTTAAASTPGDETFPPPVDDPSVRIRDDLWRAVLDHSSGYGYYWDGAQAFALEGEEPPPGELRALPRATPEELDDWRRRFVEREIARGCHDVTTQALQAWQQHGIATHALPRQVRGRWNGTLKAHVIDVLTRWFSTHGLTLPDDLTGSKHASEPVASDTEQMRRFVVRSVMGMTRSELASLSLPVSAVLRQRRDRA